VLADPSAFVQVVHKPLPCPELRGVQPVLRTDSDFPALCLGLGGEKLNPAKLLDPALLGDGFGVEMPHISVCYYSCNNKESSTINGFSRTSHLKRPLLPSSFPG
jgi:hypothetical protein